MEIVTILQKEKLSLREAKWLVQVYIMFTVIYFFTYTPSAVKKSRGEEDRDFWQGLQIIEKHWYFGIKEEILSLSTPSLTLENKEELSQGQNGGSFKRKMQR